MDDASEQRLRAALHEQAPDVPDTVVVGARSSGRRWRLPALVAALVVVASMAVGGWAVLRRAPQAPIAGPPGAPSTPQSADPCAGVLGNPALQTGYVRVATGATAVRLCRANENAPSNPPDALNTHVADLIALVNAQKKQSSHQACTLELGPHFALVFTYPDGGRSMIEGDLDGCRPIAGRSGADTVLTAYLGWLGEQRVANPPAVSNAPTCDTYGSWIPAKVTATTTAVACTGNGAARAARDVANWPALRSVIASGARQGDAASFAPLETYVLAQDAQGNLLNLQVGTTGVQWFENHGSGATATSITWQADLTPTQVRQLTGEPVASPSRPAQVSPSASACKTVLAASPQPNPDQVVTFPTSPASVRLCDDHSTAYPFTPPADQLTGTAARTFAQFVASQKPLGMAVACPAIAVTKPHFALVFTPATGGKSVVLRGNGDGCATVGGRIGAMTVLDTYLNTLDEQRLSSATASFVNWTPTCASGQSLVHVETAQTQWAMWCPAGATHGRPIVDWLTLRNTIVEHPATTYTEGTLPAASGDRIIAWTPSGDALVFAVTGNTLTYVNVKGFSQPASFGFRVQLTAAQLAPLTAAR